MTDNDTPAESKQPKSGSKAIRKHIRGSSLLFLGRLLSMGINFGTQIITVRYLAKADYGAFAWTLSIISMGTSLSLFGLDKAISRYLPIYHERKQHAAVLGTLIMTAGTILGVGISLSALVVVLRPVLLDTVVNSPLAMSLLLIMIVLAPVGALDYWFQTLFSVFANPKAIFIRRHILGPSLKFLAVLVVVLSKSNIYTLAVGYVLGGIIGVLAYLGMFVNLLKGEDLNINFSSGFRDAEFRFVEIFSFSTPLLTTDLLLIAKSSFVSVLLESLRSTVEVAEYRAVSPVADLNLVVMQSFKFLYTPLAARLYANSDKQGINDLYWRTAVWISVITFPVFIVSFSLAKPITLFLFGAKYEQSSEILRFLAVGNYFNAAFGFNSYTLRVYNKVRYIVFVDICSAIISLTLSFWLISSYGSIGAAIGTMITLVTYNLMNHLGLYFGTDIDLFQWRYLRVYLSIIVFAVGLLLVQSFFDFPLVISIVLAAVTTIIVLLINLRELEIETMFPEVARLPIIRDVLKSKLIMGTSPRDGDS